MEAKNLTAIVSGNHQPIAIPRQSGEEDMEDELCTTPIRPRFVIRCSYGNDSLALIQWAKESQLENVVILYSETGWAAKMWAERVEGLEAWARSLGFRTARTTSIGMAELIKDKQAWPQHLMQFCTYELKIKPAQEWFEKHDPDRTAIILTGVRRSESDHRKDASHFDINSRQDSGRVVVRPLVEYTDDMRDEMIRRTGQEPLPHRSRECRCVNSNREDIRLFDEGDIKEIEDLERMLGKSKRTGKDKTMFRPSRKGGAVGIREVVKWARSDRGKYVPPADAPKPEDDPLHDVEEDLYNCNSAAGGWCGI